MAHERGRFTSRTKARKRAAEVLFEADQRGIISSQVDLLDLLEERKMVNSAPSPLPAYTVAIVEGVAGDLDSIDRFIRSHAKGAGIDRIPAVDLAVMRVAVWEMTSNSEQVPPISAIDEAVSVVKQISTDTSPAYVNAVLDAIRKEVAVATPATKGEKTEPEPHPQPALSLDDLSKADFDVDGLLDELLDEY
ncbi:transcription antitermination factor NusB [Actinomyces minihominis]|uniref:transcription antitermination factor NusB n=1 Tax=Actinomyces minihominis TaxID=2002838 RepID=UPI000C08CCEE|nr:transcription antitermination factor NusB [Actinomyces minihominis]